MGQSVDQLIQPACVDNRLLCAHAPEIASSDGRPIAPGACERVAREGTHDSKNGVARGERANGKRELRNLALATTPAQCFGFGLLMQDRQGVRPYLHDANNTAVAD